MEIFTVYALFFYPSLAHLLITVCMHKQMHERDNFFARFNFSVSVSVLFFVFFFLFFIMSSSKYVDNNDIARNTRVKDIYL